MQGSMPTPTVLKHMSRPRCGSYQAMKSLTFAKPNLVNYSYTAYI